VLRERGVRVLAISGDEADESRKFARDYQIGFPLLADTDGKVSRAYTGVDANDTTVPGVIVLERGTGRVAFRQVATGKDDRLYAADIVAAVDRSLGTTGRAVDAGQQAIARLQIGGEVGGGSLDGKANATIADVIVVPLERYATVGFAARTDFSGHGRSELWLGARFPLLADVGAIQTTLIVGAPAFGPHGVLVAGRAGVWLAWTPRWAVQLDVTAGSGNGDLVLFVTAGVSRLFAW
jgi:AhpC/TSA family protein